MGVVCVVFFLIRVDRGVIGFLLESVLIVVRFYVIIFRRKERVVALFSFF